MAVMYLTVLERQNKLLVLIFFFYTAKIQGIDSLVLGTGFLPWGISTMPFLIYPPSIPH